MDCREKILSEDYYDFIVDYNVMQNLRQQENADFCFQEINENLFVVHGSRADVPNFDISTLGYETIPKCFGLQQGAQRVGQSRVEALRIEASQFAGGQPFQYGPLLKSGIIEVNGEPLSLTGRNVIIAFIDTGIRYDLEVFKNEDGSGRILAIWDQTIQTGNPPEGFYYGTEYTHEMIEEAIRSEQPYDTVPSRDENGHGTKMASVAAGSILTDTRDFRGAAPDASIVVVKLKPAKQSLKDFYVIPSEAVCYSEGDILTALKYVQGFYRVFDRPLVICLGLGTTMGDHAGNSVFSYYLNQVARRRNIGLVVCGGNEGNTAGHFLGEVTDNEVYQDVELRVGENEFGFSLFLWGGIPSVFTVEIKSPDGEVMPRVSYRIGQAQTYRFLYSASVVSVEYVLVEQVSGQQLIFMKFEKPLSGIWTIRVYAATDGSPAIYHMWLPIDGFLRSDTYFLRPNPNTTLTEPAYAESVMSISTYNSANNSFYLRSGRGFGRAGEEVPDLAAPGVDISTILGQDSGASLSAAIMAGAVADFFQWAVIERNDISVNSVTTRNYFIRGAKRDSRVIYPNEEWGYGRLDLAGVFRALIQQT